MAVINGTAYDIAEMSVLNLGQVLRQEFFKSSDKWVRMKITDREEIQLAFDEIENGVIGNQPALTLDETIAQGVIAAFEANGEIVRLDACYMQNEFLMHGKTY